MLHGKNLLCSSQKDLPKLPRRDHTAATKLASLPDRAGLASPYPDKPGQMCLLLLELHLRERREVLLCDVSALCQPNLHLTRAGCGHAEEQQTEWAAWEIVCLHLPLQVM